MFRQLATGLTIAALVTVVSPEARAQGGRTANSTIFLELGGNAFFYSLNYERVLPSDVALRAGFGYMSASAAGGGAGTNVTYLGIPLTFSYLGVNMLELGAGALFARFSGSASAGFGDEIKAGVFVPLATFIAGLRIAPAGGGFNFKLSFTPAWHPDVGFFPWGGLAFGVGF